MSKSSNTYNRQTWEEAEFPILCQTCLGDNPYLRMTKEKFGKECKICSRPFTVFRWCPGAKMRFKKTEVCQTCAKLKNACQTCILDLEYGLPIQVRDAALKLDTSLPKTDVNREYYLQNIDREVADQQEAGVVAPAGALGKLTTQKSELLSKLARTAPYYKRNRPHICSFWVKGECKRGEECPYRHERPSDPDDPLSEQNIRDRYYGNNDPVADKLMKRAKEMPALETPEDPLITTLYVAGLLDDHSRSVIDPVSETDLRNHFYQYGEIRSISMVSKGSCAFIQFAKRSSAEIAAEKTFNKLVLKGKKLTIRWGKSPAKLTATATSQEGDVPAIPGLPPALPPPPGVSGEVLRNNFFNLPPPNAGANAYFLPPPAMGGPPPGMMPPGAPLHYPSQDPSRMGAMQPHGQQ